MTRAKQKIHVAKSLAGKQSQGFRLDDEHVPPRKRFHADATAIEPAEGRLPGREILVEYLSQVHTNSLKNSSEPGRPRPRFDFHENAPPCARRRVDAAD